MTERDAPVTEDELHAYVDGALPADRIAAVEARLASDPEAASRGRRLARAGGLDPRQVGARRRRAGAGPATARAHRAARERNLAQDRSRRSRRIRHRRRRWLVRARIFRLRSQRADRARHRRRRHRGAPALHQRGPPSDRGAGRRGASPAVALAPRGLHRARPRSRARRIEAHGRPAAARRRAARPRSSCTRAPAASA